MTPRWARAMMRVDAWFGRVVQLERTLRDELLRGWLAPDEQAALTHWIFSRQRAWLPGGRMHQLGLLDWERAVIESAAFPSRGHVLVGGAGGGRELIELCARGYDVTAFEPAPALAAAAAVAAAEWPRARVACASYADFLRAAVGDGGPMQGLLDRDLDAVILGWASLSHVVTRAECDGIFHAVRKLAPRAPVLSSFYLRPERPVPLGRLEGGVRRVFAALGARDDGTTNLTFNSSAGFIRLFTRGEIEATAERTGYTVERFVEAPFPHALFVPRDP